MTLKTAGWAISLGLVGVLAGCKSGTVTQKPAPEPPRIKAFASDSYQLTEGGTANLTWDTVNATKVQLLDENGATITEGASATGAAAVKPTKSAFYVLKATGEGGADTRFVQIAVTEGLKSVFLVAVPPTVAPGGEVTLLYSAVGASMLKLTDSANAEVAITGDTGAVTVKPASSTQYTLTAKGPTGDLTATAKVSVTSAITSFVVEPRAAKPGAVMKLSWTTVNAAKVTLSERTFGQLTSSTTPATVAGGSFDFTVPVDFVADAGIQDDGGFVAGRPVPEGYPLQFTLSAESAAPVVTSTATVDAFAVEGPVINSFVAPKAVPAGQSFAVAWDVIAASVELLADGQSVFRSTASTGTATVPGITSTGTLTLIARDQLGTQVRATRTVALALTPTITSFTVPATIANAGDPQPFSWVTTNAELIVISVKDGPTVYVNSTPAQVAAGSVQLSAGTSATFVLEAFNGAGQAARLEKPVAVTNPVNFTVTPAALGTDAGVPPSIAWDLSAQGPTEMFAVPGASPFSANDDAGFVDISTSGTPIAFTSTDDSQTEIALPDGFRFPFAGQTHDKVSVGTNGALTFEPPGFVFDSFVSRNNTAFLPTTNRSPIIAVFWDDLEVGSGRAHWKIEGTEFPRKLTIQWTNFQIYFSSTTRLTFQAVLTEAGAVRLAYRDLRAGASGDPGEVRGDGATVGVYSGGSGYAATTSVDTAALNEGDVREFFTQATSVGSYAPTVPNRPLTAALLFKTPAGTVVPALARGQFSGSGAVTSVSIVEALPVPAAGVTNGQFVELFNASAAPVDLDGLRLVTTSALTAPFIFPPQTLIPANGRLVVSASTDSATNGGVTSTLSWDPTLGQVSMAPVNDELQLRSATGTVLSRLSWTTASGLTPTAGNALQVDPATKRSAFAPLVCTTTTTFGSVPQTGTPGMANTACAGNYASQSIAAAYVDISTTGRALFNADQRDERVEFLALATPFPYFGTPSSTLTVSTNGWLATSVVGTPASFNRTTTTTSTFSVPLGGIAPFWDDLAPSLFGGAAANVYFERKTDHTILQWHRYSTRSSTLVADDLNFQVKLFDSGVIEFHYAGMSSPVSANANAVRGGGATVWLEKPAPAATADIRVVDVSLNRPSILPNSALRFTPAP